MDGTGLSPPGDRSPRRPRAPRSGAPRRGSLLVLRGRARRAAGVFPEQRRVEHIRWRLAGGILARGTRKGL